MTLIQRNKQNGVLIVDYKTPQDEIEYLKSYGFEIIKTNKYNALYDAIDGHPDIQMTYINNTLYLHKDISKDFLYKLKEKNITYKLGKKGLFLPYPNNISFNALVSKDLFIHKLDFTDPLVLDEAKNLNLNLINVNQGYTRCSASYLGKDSYITEDKSIAKKLLNMSKNVFLKEHSNVFLKGFSYGFIGGAISRANLYNENLVLITGDINEYKYGRDFKSFLSNINLPYLTIGKGLLKDRGSIFQIR